MNNKIKFAIAGALGLAIGGAYNSIADVVVTAGSGTTVFDFVCFTTKHCPTAVLTNSAGTEIATSGAPVRIDPTGTTPQPVTMTSTTITGTVAATQSGTWTVQPGNTANTTPWLFNESQINGVTPLMGNGITGTGSQRVTIASDNTAFSVNAAATLNAETTKVIGTTRTLGNAGAIVDFAGQNAASPANSWLMGCQFNTTPTTISSGNASPCQLDSAGNLKVTGIGVVNGTAFAAQTFSPVMGLASTAAPTATTGDLWALSINPRSGGVRIDQEGCTPYHLSGGTTAATNSTNIKNAAGTLCRIVGLNTTTTIAYLKVYNLSAAPTCSSATGIVHVYPIPPAGATGGVGGYQTNEPIGETYSTGIGFCVTGGGTDTDNTNSPAGVFIEANYK